MSTFGEERICVTGLWHLGTVTCAGLAELGFSVVGVDAEPERVRALEQGHPPIFEPGLAELLARHLATGRLRFSTDLAGALPRSPFVLVTYDTPVDEQDRVDLTQIYAAAEVLAEHLEPNAIVIVNSQVPVGTCEEIQRTIQVQQPNRPFGLAYVPENLRLGRALERFFRPAMIVIGASEPNTWDRVEQFYASVPAPKLRMDLKSAEMTKHAINAYLATCISFINELTNLCDEAGAEATKVAEALRRDERVSPHAPLAPGGLGFAGGTLARDLRALQAVGARLNCPTHLVDAVLAVNQEQRRIVFRRLSKVYGSVAGLTVGILGLTYKPGTSTLRRSAALEIINDLVRAGAQVKAYDPHAALEEVGEKRNFAFYADPAPVAAGSDALVIVTEWPEFRNLDYPTLTASMKRPVLIDTKNLLDPEPLRRKGILYLDVGRGGIAASLAHCG
ncbi:MAG: hypothetical protein A3G41_04210 [Elusimicrobia bacterium RIFCSPLOWO2_12_FULL_59_9]|nr:MAG: hypothetical protein A3G41_04210 [Elusimicrobia bacterium RIFCSPLOWO2_12_FULL_59_9]